MLKEGFVFSAFEFLFVSTDSFEIGIEVLERSLSVNPKRINI
jgi:hypothetical protein